MTPRPQLPGLAASEIYYICKSATPSSAAPLSNAVVHAIRRHLVTPFANHPLDLPWGRHVLEYSYDSHMDASLL